MRQTDLYFLCGQGDAASSPGIVAMHDRFKDRKGVRAKLYYWHQWAAVVADINERAKLDVLREAVTYSMGANALTWILGGVNSGGHTYPGISVPFDWACFIDPTVLSVITPLDGMCGDALHFHNNSLDPVGHGTIVQGRKFNANLEVVETHLPHLALDVDPEIQGRIMKELNERIGT